MTTQRKSFHITIVILTMLFSIFSIVGHSQSDYQSYKQVIDKQIQESILNNYERIAPYFVEAYTRYPSLPQGILEVVAFTYTRFANPNTDTIENDPSAIPRTYSVMGLTLHGKGVFRENLRLVSRISGLPIKEIVENPKAAIMAYAQSFAYLQQKYRCFSPDIEAYRQILIEMSEIPIPENPNDDFALNSSLYAIYHCFADHTLWQYGIPNYNIDFKRIFGKNLHQLQRKNIFIEAFSEDTLSQKAIELSKNVLETDYAGAIWNPAGSCNYSNGRGGTPISNIVIHYTQGTYSGAIAWFQNCTYNGVGAQASSHYVIRSFDGQVTQMVREKDKAWHVRSANPYTIGIEHEAYGDIASFFTTAMYESSAALVRDICQRRPNISPLRMFYRDTLDDGTALNSGLHNLGGSNACTQIRGHQHYPDQTHTDPGPFWNWNYYYKLVNYTTPVDSSTAISGVFADSGGEYGSYASNERKLFLIHVPEADSIELISDAFDLETDYDFMWIYDGNSVYSPLIGRWNTQSPGRVVASGENLLVEFRSDCATESAGWVAHWNAYFTSDEEEYALPTTDIDWNEEQWITDDFNLHFLDSGTNVQYRFYQIMEKNEGDWSANVHNGFFCDNFDHQLNENCWLPSNSNWQIENHALCQLSQNLPEATISAMLNQNLSYQYLYDFYLKVIEGEKVAFYFACDRPIDEMQSLNGYKLTFDRGAHLLILERIVNGIGQEIGRRSNFYMSLGQNSLYRILYDRTNGTILVFRHGNLLAEFTDFTMGTIARSYFGFQTIQTSAIIDNLRVYRSRESDVCCTVGSEVVHLLQAQALEGESRTKIKSVILDSEQNFSNLAEKWLKIDYTPPTPPDFRNVSPNRSDYSNALYLSNPILINWSNAKDEHSGIKSYHYAFYKGNLHDSQNRLNWINIGCTHSLFVNPLDLQYYTGLVLKSENHAGLYSQPVVVDNSCGECSPRSEPSIICHVFPNPATTEVMVAVEDVISTEGKMPFNTRHLKCQLCNLNGIIIEETELYNQASIILSHYPIGVYIIYVLEQDRVVFQEKLVKR